MKLISNQTFGGERPLFGLKDVRLENIEIVDGESGIKCCNHMEAANSRFLGKYPWWHVDGAVIDDCYFAPGSRSAIWYCSDLLLRRCTIDGPKFFREIKGLQLEDVTITDADETFWKVDDIRARNLVLQGGTYPFMNCKNVYVDHLKSDAKYIFQYCQNVEVHHADIITKDSFWECDNVVVYDSVLNGEYLAWHSRNIRLVRCHIAGEQPLCYMDHVTLEDCTFDPACDRAFEDSSHIDASINGAITEVKNPISGHIVADHVDRITYDDFALGHDCVVESKN